MSFRQEVPIPYTEKQRKLFHAVAEDPDVAREHGISRREGRRLAAEADKLTREGKEKPPVKKAVENFIDLGPVFFGRSDTY